MSEKHGDKRGVSRRNFLRLKPERGRTIELSVRTVFMPDADAGSGASGDPEHPSFDDLLQDFARRLEGADVVKLFEPEWLESMDASDRVRAVLAQFEARGGRVEEQW